MRYFLDTEFIEDGKTIDLISIAIAAEDGREFYVLNVDCDWSRANQWVQENVLAKLPEKPKTLEANQNPSTNAVWLPRSEIAAKIAAFIGEDVPEFWAYCASYDWVALCQLFGTMMDLPQGFPTHCCDLKQEADRLGVNLLEVISQDNQHDALADARWDKQAFDYLTLQARGMTVGEDRDFPAAGGQSHRPTEC